MLKYTVNPLTVWPFNMVLNKRCTLQHYIMNDATVQSTLLLFDCSIPFTMVLITLDVGCICTVHSQPSHCWTIIHCGFDSLHHTCKCKFSSLSWINLYSTQWCSESNRIKQNMDFDALCWVGFCPSFTIELYLFTCENSLHKRNSISCCLSGARPCSC